MPQGETDEETTIGTTSPDDFRPSTGHVSHGQHNLKRIGARGVALVERLATEGATNTGISKALRIYRGTFADICKRQPEVAEALARGRAALEEELTDLLLSHARKGNVVASIFLAKARCGWREGEAAGGPTQAVQVNIQIPAPMSPEEFKAIREGRL